MRILTSISLLLLILSSCAVSLFDGYGRSERTLSELSNLSFWFENDTTYRLFHAAIDLKKNHYSGMMVFNPLPEGGYRVIYMTGFGMKIFDMEYPGDGTYILHYCLPALNRRSVLKLLGNDIGLLSGHMTRIYSDKVLYEKKTGKTVVLAEDNRNRYHYVFDDKTKKVNTIIQSTSMIRKVRLDFFSKDGFGLDSLKLAHYHINLNIKFTQIDETTTSADE